MSNTQNARPLYSEITPVHILLFVYIQREIGWETAFANYFSNATHHFNKSTKPSSPISHVPRDYTYFFSGYVTPALFCNIFAKLFNGPKKYPDRGSGGGR